MIRDESSFSVDKAAISGTRSSLENGYRMKATPTRTLSIGMGIAIVAVSALLVSSSATAANFNTVTFVVAGDVLTGSGPAYGAAPSMWTESNSSTISSELTGLALGAGADFANQFVTPIVANTGGALVGFATGTSVGDSSMVNAYARIYYTVDGTPGVLTADSKNIRPWSSNTVTWTASVPIGSRSNGTLSQFDTAMTTHTADSFLYAAGIRGDNVNATTLTSFILNGKTFLFTPAPVSTVTLTPITPAEYAADGFTVTTTGYIPFESIQPVFGTLRGDRPFGSIVSADSAGSITFTYKPSAETATAGTWRLRLLPPANSYRDQSFLFDVADAGAGADALPATGAEPMGMIVAAGTFGLVGAGILVAIAIRRKKAVRA
jgi:LPXTG-motif cell wall-anchored protein